MTLKGKIAIVTGSSSGIGYTTALRFAEAGAAVVLAARRIDRLHELAKKIEEIGSQALCVQADVTLWEDCQKVADQAYEAFGRIDILVNNAGIGDNNVPITRCSNEFWDQVILMDQTSVFYMTKAVLKYMEPAGSGSIVNVSSIGGVFGNSGAAYSSAKTAVIGLTKNVAIQFAGLGIRCNAVCPGPTPTELNLPEKDIYMDHEFLEVCLGHLYTKVPMANTGNQADAILFFASDASSAITGQYLVVDNGATL